MCSYKSPEMPPPPPPPPAAPKPYMPKVEQDPNLSSMRSTAARLGSNQLIIPLRPVNPL
jgi:hypothetical protein